MKTLSLIALLGCTLATATLPAAAQDEPATEEILQWQRDFENLEPETRKKVTEQVVRAGVFFRQKRVFEALNLLFEAEGIHGDIPDLHNMKGACYVEFRDFVRARESFNRANELSPNNPDILFNLAELSFVTHQWPVAEREFERVLSLIPEDKLPMRRLVEFKILLSKMKLEKSEEAMELARKYDHTDDSPFHYYAEAAIAYQEDDIEKAERWLRIAQRVFRQGGVLTPWTDTLVEYGYIKSFYGGDLEDQG